MQMWALQQVLTKIIACCAARLVPTPLRAPDEYRLRQPAVLQEAGPPTGLPESGNSRSGLTPVRLVLPAKGRADLVMPLAEDADGGEPCDEVLPAELNFFCAVHLQEEHMFRCLAVDVDTMRRPCRPTVQAA